MMKLSYPNFIAEIENRLNRIIRRCTMASWDENHITFTIVDEFSSAFQNISIEGLDRPFKLKWDARKLRRPTEETLGDLAILVHLETWEGERIEGVGALEAKLRTPNKASFDSVRPSQLNRISKKSPHSHLLLYDYAHVTGFTDNLASTLWSGDNHFSFQYSNTTLYSHCVTLPVSTALSIGKYNTSLYKFCVPFSIQLCSRYFRGYDLETDPKIVVNVKNNVQRYGGFRYLWLIGISTGESEPVLPPGISDDSYEPLSNNI
jgi:hypothetical protein